jgi:leucyl-tRNA synthetase
METITLLMAPSTPYVAEEMWSRLGKDFSVHLQTWPTYDESLVTVATVEVPVQVNGKVRGRIDIAAGAPDAEMLSAAWALEKIQEFTAGKTVVREIVVPGRLVNIIVK